MGSPREVPSGTVTLMFCDIEGSTALARGLGDHWLAVLAAHRRILRDAVCAHGGVELGTEGDGLRAVFGSARDAVAAAADAQRELAAYRWPAESVVRVRIGLHTGEPEATSEGYEGLDMHCGARVMAAGHGGQVLLTRAAREILGERLPPGVTVRDLGEFVLRDFPRPERLFQLVVDGVRSTFPPLRTGKAWSTNVPQPSTPLIGREREVSQVTRLLARESRLVTLTGPGGVGKTRLALDVALERAPAHFVSLASVADPSLVAATLAQSFGVIDRGDRPTIAALTDALAGDRLLLVLDNLEHLLTATPLVAELLAACPQLSVLVTSREPLRLRGEHVFRVAPLLVPEPETVADLSAVAHAPATALFVERARTQDASFELTPDTAPAITDICARLDGLPLAIELAAARVGLLTVGELAARLGAAIDVLAPGPRDAPARQQTLRAAMDWSFRLLEQPEREAFTALAVFRGGCTLQAAETVPSAALATVESLLAKSLIVRRGGRLGMLETVRQYATERLEHRPDADRTHRRHAEYYLNLAMHARDGIVHGNQHDIGTVDAEIDNLRAALTWALDRDPSLLVGMSVALCEYWAAAHRRDEGERWVDSALRSSMHGATSAAKAELLLARARLRSPKNLSDPRDARGALALFEQLGDHGGASRSLAFLSEQETFLTHWQPADALADQAVARARITGDDMLIGAALRAKSIAQEHLDDAAPIAEQAAEHLRRAGNHSYLGLLLSTTGFIAIVEEAYERADQFLHEALAVATAARDIQRVATVRGNQGLAALFRGRIDAAAEAFREELVLCRNSRLSRGGLVWEGLTGLAAVAAAEGRPKHAAQLAGAASTCPEKALDPADAPVYARLSERFLEPARAACGEDAWHCAYRNGTALTIEDAVATALDDPAETHPVAHQPR